jgi:hypothetical protein
MLVADGLEVDPERVMGVRTSSHHILELIEALLGCR